MRTLFENATVIDGSAGAPFKANVLIEDSKISKISSGQTGLETGDTRSIDCTGKILCPGFMDMHAHSDLEVLRDPTMSHKVQQGITFDLSGNCGVAVYPRKINDSPVAADIIGHYDNWSWTDFISYRSLLKPGINIALLQGHSCLRIQAIDGNPNRAATKEEIDALAASKGFRDNRDGNGVNYISERLYLEDMHPANVFIDPQSGKPICIDCIVKFIKKE